MSDIELDQQDIHHQEDRPRSDQYAFGLGKDNDVYNDEVQSFFFQNGYHKDELEDEEVQSRDRLSQPISNPSKPAAVPSESAEPLQTPEHQQSPMMSLLSPSATLEPHTALPPPLANSSRQAMERATAETRRRQHERFNSDVAPFGKLVPSLTGAPFEQAAREFVHFGRILDEEKTLYFCELCVGTNFFDSIASVSASQPLAAPRPSLASSFFAPQLSSSSAPTNSAATNRHKRFTYDNGDCLKQGWEVTNEIASLVTDADYHTYLSIRPGRDKAFRKILSRCLPDGFELPTIPDRANPVIQDVFGALDEVKKLVIGEIVQNIAGR